MSRVVAARELHNAASAEAGALQARLTLDGANASLISETAVAAFGRAAHRLLAGQPVQLFVVGGSAAAGAGGAAEAAVLAD